MNRVYLVPYEGLLSGGLMLISDETKEKAFQRAKKEIKEQGLEESNEEFTIDDLSEIDQEKPEIRIILDGMP